MEYRDYWGGEIGFQVESMIQDYSNYPKKEKLEKVAEDKKLFEELKNYVADKIVDDGYIWEVINDSMSYYIEDYLREKNNG